MHTDHCDWLAIQIRHTANNRRIVPELPVSM